MPRPDPIRIGIATLSSPRIREFAAFVAMRVACAALSYGAYLVLLQWASYEFAYLVSYVAGIALAYFTNAAWVFKKPMTRRSASAFPVVYLVQFALGFVILKLLIDGLNVPEWLALGLSVLVTLPITYVLSRWAVHK